MQNNPPELRVGLLGPVCVWSGPQVLSAGPPQRQAVLALLAGHRGRSVSTGRLVDAMWGENPPSSAAGRVHVQISALRRLLEPRQSHGTGHRVLCRESGGYRLDLGREQVDLDHAVHLFGRAASARASGDPAAAADAATRAPTDHE